MRRHRTVNHVRWTVLGAALSLASAGLARADVPSGLELARRATDDTSGYGGQRANAKLTLHDPSGAERVFQLVQLWREGEQGGEGTQSLIRFTAPADIAGTALLTRERAGGEDERWLYLASAKELKQVSGTQGSAAFLGSEFTYEDLRFALLSDYEWKRVGEDTVKDRKCHEVERTPRFAGSAYRRTVICYDAEHGYALRMRYYDAADQVVKVARLEDYRPYGGKWRAHRIEMENAQSKRRSVYATERFEVGLTLSPRLFTPSQMQKQSR